MNVDADRSFAIDLNGLNTDGTTFGTAVREEYVLSSAGVGPPGPHQSTLSSLNMLLNGKLLELELNNTIPAGDGFQPRFPLKASKLSSRNGSERPKADHVGCVFLAPKTLT